MKVAVTGGAGFIGSHLVDKLIEQNHDVLVVDNLSSGRREYVNKNAVLVRKDILEDLSKELSSTDAVFHLAADPDVRASAENPEKSFDINVRGTFSVLEACRKADVGRFILASTSTVYGDASVIPTPESHPCNPISNYGASKLACEAYASSYAHSYGIQSSVLRLANIFGERGSHGVMYDFFNKLKKNPKKLEILGDGNQDKSYLYISDCISAIMLVWKKQKAPYEVFNVGSHRKIKVTEIANLICKNMGLNPDLYYTGTLRGWPGDVRLMQLDVKKLEALGWKEEIALEAGMARYVNWLNNVTV